MICMQGGSIFYVCTKFQVDSSFRMKVITGSHNFEIGPHDPGHAHLGVVLYSIRRMDPSSISVPNLKQIAPFVQKLLGGPKISKFGHVTLSHAPFAPETLNLCRNPCSHICNTLPNFMLLA